MDSFNDVYGFFDLPDNQTSTLKLLRYLETQVQ